ncbi:MAG: hypothetical protein RLY31_270 [Bacteroidota bacterium]|jgi:hypothetical protein
MATQTKSLRTSDLHFENKYWLNELKFAASELLLFQQYLERLAKQEGPVAFFAQIEQYQNQFIREKEVIDIILHDIRRNEQRLAEFTRNHPVTYDLYEMDDHDDLRDGMDRFRKIFGELKTNFFHFYYQQREAA